MRLRAADTDGPRGSDTTSTPIKFVDATRLNSPPLVILWKAQATRPGQHPRRSGGRQHMSNSETRGSVIVGVCQQDPERWRDPPSRAENGARPHLGQILGLFRTTSPAGPPGALIAAELGLEPSTVFVNACRVLKRVRAVCEEFDEDMSHAFDSSLSRGE